MAELMQLGDAAVGGASASHAADSGSWWPRTWSWVLGTRRRVRVQRNQIRADNARTTGRRWTGLSPSYELFGQRAQPHLPPW